MPDDPRQGPALATGQAGGAVGQPIAIIGMAGRFPGAPDVAALWQNLLAGRESITRFAVEDLLAAGRDPAVVSDPRFVPAEGVLDDIESFDAAFFGYSPREASVMDPQHRLGLEAAWHAFENAGCDPARAPGPAGVFIGVALSSYLIRNLLPNAGLVRELGGFPLLVHNDKDFAATTIAHKLGLTGPALAVGTACSSSLVAVHLAAQSLLAGECDLALAGGVSLQVPQGQGYVHDGAGIYSPDGHCRAFDAAAAGTVGGSGVAMVLLKRLDDALRDRDRVHAVLLGSAVNNDGGASLGYTAPGVDGQTAVIAEAQAAAGVPARSIGYVEAHGTATPLGDAVEVDALTQAFNLSSERTHMCALGSVKANVGHLDAAAGVTGLIKAALTVKHGLIPPHPCFSQPNPRIAFEKTPFYVNAEALAWPHGTGPRRAGVSSFGIGGTNAHVIIEQPPEPAARPDAAAGPWHLLTVSAASPAAADAAAAALAGHVHGRPATGVADLAFTLASRRGLAHRRAVACADGADAAAALADAERYAAGVHDGRDRPLTLMFPGQGAEYAGMAAGLHAAEPAFRAYIDECAGLLGAAGPGVLAALLDDGDPDLPGRPAVAQPALFAFEYALAQTLIGWGLEPAALIGHSLGEYAAACVAGALSLPDALRLVAGRGALMERVAPGAMLAVGLPEAALSPLLPPGACVAAVNAPDACVAAGPRAALRRLAADLERSGTAARWLPVARPYHSAGIDPVLAEFAELARPVTPGPARRPWISTLTGDWMPAGSATGPGHWVRQLRETVRFDLGLGRLLGQDDAVFIEAGPAATLSSIVTRHPGRGPGQMVISAQPRRAPSSGSRHQALLDAVGQAWVAGCLPDPAALFAAGNYRKTDAPLYPFQRKRHWVDPPPEPGPAGADRASFGKIREKMRRRLAAMETEEPVRGIASYPGLAPGLDELCAALVLRYLAGAGVETGAGARHDVAGLRRRLRIRGEYERFLDFMLGVLADDAVLERHGETVRFLGGTRPRDPAAIAAELRRDHPGFRGLVELLGHCAAHYGEALSEAGAALGVLYPDGRGDLLRRTLGEETADYSVTGRLVRLTGTLVANVADAAAPGRTLRVLEIGAGGGRLTWELAGVLRGRPAEYLVTDVGRLFVSQLAEEAGRRGLDIRTGLFDIGRDPAGQGLAPGSFDVIAGLDVVHVAPDVPAALASLRRLLAPSGYLALAETVAQDRWLSMVWGLSAEWWGFTDALRGRTPLLGGASWERAVRAHGFAEVAVLPGSSDPGTADSALVLAQAPAGPVPSPAGAAPAWGATGGALVSLPEKRADVGSWGYLPQWRRGPLPEPAAAGLAGPGRCAVFSAGPLGDAVAARLSQRGLTVEVVRPGAGPGDYEALLDRLAGADNGAGLAGAGLPRYVLHAWSAGPVPAGPRLDRLDETQDRGLFSLLELARALGERAGAGPVRLLAVTSLAQDVLGGELSAPERSTVQAAIKVISVEYPRISCGCVDVPAAGPGTADEAWLAGLADELLAQPGPSAGPASSTGAELDAGSGGPAGVGLAAYRGRSRWTPCYLPWRLEPAAEPAPGGPAVRPRPGGVYLICGGLGGIGLSLAGYLGRLPASVVLTRRAAFPPREQWADWLAGHPPEDPTSAAIQRLTEIESAGGRTLVLRADITSVDDMRDVVARTVERFGAITGVIHAAGVRDTAGVIERRDRASTWATIAAKVRGPLVLEEVLRGQDPEFVVLCSSIGTVLHKLKFGEVGYVAGNEFLNAYAACAAGRGRAATVAIAWTDWLEAGMWTEARKHLSERYEITDVNGFDPASDLLRGLTTAEGIEVFRRVLARPAAPHVVISTQDLGPLLASHAAFTQAERIRILETMRLAPGAHRRPELRSPYTPPRTGRERAAAAVWESVLGIDGVGTQDDFFALGGDSLLALRLLARMREDVGLDRSIAELFRAPTIAGLLSAAVAAGDDAGEEVVVL